MLRFYNTLFRKKMNFEPREGKKVKMFVCGPTVYDYSHIGHARTYIVFDVIARYLRYSGYSVFYIQNITDIDDKIIDRANAQNISPRELSEYYLRAFFEDMNNLGINTIRLYAPATEHIPQIINQIQRLIEKKYAYVTDDGVYFDISKFPEYGKLSHQSIHSLIAGSRVDINTHKRNPIDFVLWKKKKAGEPYWPSPWGDGRPGWHIEDTAITEHYLGAQYDLHGGGSDLIFPHHECEIAQMEAISGKSPMVRYWLHTGLVTIEDVRMGKSMGNAITIRDILKIVRKEVLRFYVLSSHYRSPVNYSVMMLEKAKRSWERIVITYYTLKNMRKFATSDYPELIETLKNQKAEFKEAMDDDLNTPKAISVIMRFILWIFKNLEKLSKSNVQEILAYFDEIDGIFQIIPHTTKTEEKIINLIIEIREQLRKNKQYVLSDQIRNQLKAFGIVVQDNNNGAIWYLT